MKLRHRGVSMKLHRLLLPAFAAIQISCAAAQTPPASDNAATSRPPDPAATLTYIHDAWNNLTRSMTDCHSLVDIKVTAHPVLYMPADVTAPPSPPECWSESGSCGCVGEYQGGYLTMAIVNGTLHCIPTKDRPVPTPRSDACDSDAGLNAAYAACNFVGLDAGPWCETVGGPRVHLRSSRGIRRGDHGMPRGDVRVRRAGRRPLRRAHRHVQRRSRVPLPLLQRYLRNRHDDGHSSTRLT